MVGLSLETSERDASSGGADHSPNTLIPPLDYAASLSPRGLFFGPRPPS
jgi:hypothetical protein